MPADREGSITRHDVFKSIEVGCVWCGASVPLPAGEYSGVCIDCGTVMFRLAGKAVGSRNHFRNDVRGSGGSFAPAPAV